MANRQEKIDSLRRYTNLIRKQTGRVVRPYRPYRMDGYVNMLTKYGTSRDSSERYEFRQEPPVPDEQLSSFYEGNGLFAKIIDSPAEEAVKNGFELEGMQDQQLEDFYKEALEELDWEETVMTAVKWARLFGGSIAVMMINDGRGVDEPLDWKNIRSIDDIRIYDRSLLQPDYNSMFSYDPDDPFGTRGSRLGMPEYYDVYSRYGNFRVHDSRCLVFQNGLLPENTTNSIYQLWGMPEYIRINKAIRDAEIAHGTAPKMLDRSIQAVYRMKDLSSELATEEGEDRVLRRLQTIDMARGLLNSITIDSEGEDYDFRQFSFTGVSEVIDTTCNFLSALTSIPQTILFGRSPAGMNSTGMGDMENWYNYLERIQNRMIKKNLRYLLSIIFQAGVCTGEIDEVPPIKVKFNPLWSLSDQEEASLEQLRAQVANTKANTAAVYVQMQALDPSEVRKKLADSEEFDVESMLDEYSDEELEENDPMKKQQAQGGMPGMGGGAPGGMPGMMPPEGGPEGGGPEGPAPEAPAPGNEKALGQKPEGPKDSPKPELAQGGKEKDTDIGGNAPAAAPAATKLPVDMSGKEKAEAEQTREVLAERQAPEEKRGTETQQKPIPQTEGGKEKTAVQEGQAKGPIINGPKKEKKPLPGDTLRNAWLGNTPEDGVQEKKEEQKPEAEKPKEKKLEAEKPKLKPAPKDADKKADPGDTLRNAWLGITPEDAEKETKKDEDPYDTLKRAWHGTESEAEDTLRNAWLGNTPKRPPHGSRSVRTRKGDISIRDYRASSRQDAGAQGAVGVYVIKDGKVLTGIRGTGDGEHLICGPGGHIEEGETPGQAAIRETQEEFGITPMELIPFGMGEKQINGLRPNLFLCVRFEGTPKCDEQEMHQARFTAIEEIENSGRLFRPFEAGFQKLVKQITGRNVHADDEDWVTIKGTHVLLNENGEAQSGGNLKGKTFANAKSQKKSLKLKESGSFSPGPPTAESISESMKPKNPEYALDLDDDMQDFMRKNAGNKRKPTALYTLYHETEANGGDGQLAVEDEYYKTRLSKCTEGLKEISKDEAEEILYDNLKPGTLQAWFQEYNHEVKQGLLWQMTRNPETHNAALNQMYTNYKYQCQADGTDPLPFEEFLVTPIKMYRGGTGKEYDEAAVFSSYTFNRKAAESFTGSEVGQGASYDPNGVVYEAIIRPIDTYGSVYTNGESEILVPRPIAPNKNRDSAEEE